MALEYQEVKITKVQYFENIYQDESNKTSHDYEFVLFNLFWLIYN